MKPIRIVKKIDKTRRIHVSMDLPPSFPDKVEVLIVPIRENNTFETLEEVSSQPTKISGFVAEVLGDPSEDIWNDL